MNVALCLSELPAAERRRLVRRSLIETGRSLAEAGAMWRWPEPRLAALLEGADRGELLERAVAGGRGVVLLLPHVGNWEYMNHFLTARRLPFTALYRPPRVAEMEREIRRGRERTGAVMAPASAGGLKTLHRTLRIGGVVVVLPDQEPLKRHGVFAPFFGVPALTMTLVGALLRRFGAAPLFAWAERRPAGFRVRFLEPPAGLDAADRVEAAACLNAGVEACVRACPEQYTWSYKRFRTRPVDETPALRYRRP